MTITAFELFDTDADITTTRTLLHESIPLTGTIVSGTYGAWLSEGNIKNYSHGMFQSVYDYPYLSSSANHIFDIAVGYDESSALSGSSNRVQQAKKINMYNQFSQVLLGYTGSNNTVRKFELDLSLDNSGSFPTTVPLITGSTVCTDGVFVNFTRLITKDQIKMGTFSITVGYGAWAQSFGTAGQRVLSDSKTTTSSGSAETLGGDYGVLYDTGSTPHGVVFYESGIVLLSGSAFKSSSAPSSIASQFFRHPKLGFQTYEQAITGSSISGSCDAVRHRIRNISFNNTTEINSTIYFCRVPHNKYNHSSNPTYLSSSTIRVKNVASDQPIAYITTIGLYGHESSQLLAIAKLSEPLRKDPTNELTLRVRLDY